MKKKEEAKWQKALLIIIMLLVSVSLIGGAAYLYGKSFRDIFTLIVISAAYLGAVIFSLIQSDIYGELHYDNGGHYARFVLVFLFGVAVCCILPSIPESGWAVPSVALALALFSNTVTGIAAYAGLISICVYLASADILVFALCFLTGCIFAILFEKLDDEYRTGIPMFIAMLIYIVSLTAKTVFQNKGALSVERFIVPIVNVFITYICMLAVLRFYCAAVVDKEKGKYLAINDQEFKLLAKYKTEDRQLYYNAIHTAHFAEKTARMLHMDVDLAKNGGYYHRIIVAECNKKGKTLEEICKKYKFPPKAVQLLQEYNYKNRPIKMRETAAVYIADSVVATLMYLNSKEEDDKNSEEIDYTKLVKAIIKRKIDSGVLSRSDISLSDIGDFERIYAGENLYYDFLRRE